MKIWVYLSLIIALLGAFFYVRNEFIKVGFERCELQHAKAIAQAESNSKRDAEQVKKEEKSLSDPELDDALCQLGIVQNDCGE